MSGNKRHKRTQRIEVRLSESEYALLKAYAESKNQPMTEAIRDWIKSTDTPLDGLTEAERRHFEEIRLALKEIAERQEETLRQVKRLNEQPRTQKR